MRTISANLIPKKRLAAQRVTSRIRLWSGVLAMYVVALGGVYAAMHGTVGGDAADVQAQLAKISGEITTADAELTRSRAELANAARLLASAQELRDHPDWSALLQAISVMKGENVVLGSLELVPATDAGKGKEPLVARPSRYALRLTGLARDHQAATAFSLHLERSGVFSSVDLTGTSAQEIGSKSVVSFGLECEMDESGGGP